ncbi:MAG: hypothetical protein LBT23_03210 [Synergistaceae bacterium]|jgi:hypothetical protein|nr:hypothetical protein [Synergistaceae bacterium]
MNINFRKTSDDNEYIDYFQLFFATALSSVLLLIVVIRAVKTGITYDEGYTYITYARDLSIDKFPEIFRNAVANNHWLNTILINLVRRASNADFNEFLIRLPVIVSYALYMILLLFLFYKKRISLWVFCLFVLSYYLNEFFGLARGYGFAVFLNTAGLFLYNEWKLTSRDIFISMGFLCFAVSAASITLSLLVLLPVGIVVLARMVHERRLGSYAKSQILWLVFVGVICALMAVYNYNISHGDGPIPPSGSSNLYGAFAEGFVRMFMQNERLARGISIVSAVAFVGSMIFFARKIPASNFVLPFFLHLLIWFLAHLFSGFYPEDRTLLASFPLIVLSIVEIASWVANYLTGSRWKDVYSLLAPGIKIFVAIFLAICFFNNISLNSTHDWRNNYDAKYTAYEVYNKRSSIESYPPDLTASMTFYRYKIMSEFGFDIFMGRYVGRGIYGGEK